MTLSSLLLLLPVALAASVVLHLLVGRGIKAVLWAASPLASGEVEALTYERRVYRSGDWAMAQVVGLVVLAGLLFGVGLALRPPVATGLKALACAVWLGALGLDLLRWHRVSVAASAVRYQRGLRGRVHALPMDAIQSVSVQEKAARGITWREGRHARLAGLVLRMNDQRVVACPRTDALTGLASVEALADFVRMRLQQMHAPGKAGAGIGMQAAAPAALPPVARPGGETAARAPAPVPEHAPGTSPSTADAELRQALKRLRRQAAADRPVPPSR